jgi:hypothetical protein
VAVFDTAESVTRMRTGDSYKYLRKLCDMMNTLQQDTSLIYPIISVITSRIYMPHFRGTHVGTVYARVCVCVCSYECL